MIASRDTLCQAIHARLRDAVRPSQEAVTPVFFVRHHHDSTARAILLPSSSLSTGVCKRVSVGVERISGRYAQVRNRNVALSSPPKSARHCLPHAWIAPLSLSLSLSLFIVSFQTAQVKLVGCACLSESTLTPSRHPSGCY